MNLKLCDKHYELGELLIEIKSDVKWIKKLLFFYLSAVAFVITSSIAIWSILKTNRLVEAKSYETHINQNTGNR